MTFPLALTPFKRDEAASLAGTRIPGDRGTAALVSSLVSQLARRLGDDDAAGAAQLGTAVLDLLTVMLAARIRQPGPVPPPARKRALLASVHAFAEEHPGDPGLSPGVIAAAHHISGPAGVRHGRPLGLRQRRHFRRAFRAAYGLPPGEFRLAYADQGNKTAAARPAAS